MTYNKQTWKTGEIITEGKLNHIENGIATNDSAISDLNEAKSILSENILNLQNNKANQTEVDEIQADITSINGDITTISNTVDTLQTGVQSNTENITNLQNALPNKQDKLTAGDNITINENNVISATTSGGSVPENMVTTDTEQTISGTKLFSSMQTRFTQGFILDSLTSIKTSDEVSRNLLTYSDNACEIGINYRITKILGSQIVNSSNKKLLTQSSITGTNNITITETTDGIQVAGLSNSAIAALAGMTNNVTIYTNVVSNTEYTTTEAGFWIAQGETVGQGYITIDIKYPSGEFTSISGVNGPQQNYYLITPAIFLAAGETIRVRHGNVSSVTLASFKTKGGV